MCVCRCSVLALLSPSYSLTYHFSLCCFWVEIWLLWCLLCFWFQNSGENLFFVLCLSPLLLCFAYNSLKPSSSQFLDQNVLVELRTEDDCSTPVYLSLLSTALVYLFIRNLESSSSNISVTSWNALLTVDSDNFRYHTFVWWFLKCHVGFVTSLNHCCTATWLQSSQALTGWMNELCLLECICT